MSGGRKGIEKQMLVIKDRAEFIEILDGLGDDGIALLIARKKVEGENQLRISSYGEAQETEFLGLLGYGTIMLHREYFRDDDE